MCERERDEVMDRSVTSLGAYRLHTSISGPYFSLLAKSSGAAYSGDPQWVFISSSLENVTLSPKSATSQQADR